MFSLNVFHPDDNNLLNISEIYSIIDKLIRTYENKPFEVGIGALTGDERDVWAHVKTHIKIKKL